MLSNQCVSIPLTIDYSPFAHVIMKRLLLLPCLFLVSVFSSGQDLKLSNELLDYYHQKLAGIDLKSSDTDVTDDRFWMSPFLKTVFTQWDNLTVEAQETFEVYKATPTLLGTEKVYIATTFKFHYTTDSGDSDQDVDATDSDNSGVPDYIESMASAFTLSEQKYHNELGLTHPVYNDGYYHIYVSGTAAGDGIYGYVAASSAFVVGDNPNSPDIVEVDASGSYMVMRNSYEEFRKPEIALTVTAAHEYLHSIQYGYDWHFETWFAEATASWGEEYVFPGADDNLQYLYFTYKYPDVALNYSDYDGVEFAGHWYGMFIFIQYLVEQTDASIITQLFEELIGSGSSDSKSIAAITEVLKTNWSSRSSSFFDIFCDYSIANTILSDNEAFYAPYVYTRAADYKAYVSRFLYLEGSLNFEGSTVNFDSKVDGNSRLMRLSYDQVGCIASSNFKLTLTCDNDQVFLVLVKFSADDAKLVVPTGDMVLNVTDHELWDGYQIIVIRKDIDVTNTLSADYSLQIERASTSTSQNDDNAHVLFYPNPAIDHISFDSAIPSQTVNVFDVSGKLVISKLIDNQKELVLSDLARGCYFLQYADASDVLHIERLLLVTH